MLAIIPARGGSKGLPGKNIKFLNGKPLIVHTIEAASKTKAISEVIVSTDDVEIAEVAKKAGASIPFMRPPELALDNSLAIDAYLYTVDKLERDRNIKINEIVVLLPTSPLRTPVDIEQAVALFERKDADSVISYVEEDHPIAWHKKIAADQRIILDEAPIQNRQQYDKTYYPNGSIYIFKSAVLRAGKYFTEKSYAYLMPKERSIDIDTAFDFDLATFYLMRNG
jgi:N-acylneuraminate cytidylyltransferase/CMP-N,N'-diacetyllegionaminic acid synthase